MGERQRNRTALGQSHQMSTVDANRIEKADQPLRVEGAIVTPRRLVALPLPQDIRGHYAELAPKGTDHGISIQGTGRRAVQQDHRGPLPVQ
jgi:hypothetical protein